MNEVSQEILSPHESEAEARARRKDQISGKKRAVQPSGPARNGADLLCDAWQLSNTRRLLIGFVGMAFAVPYLGVCLTYPEWAGHIGSRISLALFSLLGQAALTSPFLLAYGVLSCAGLRPLRKTRYAYAIPLLIALALLSQRWAEAGGWLGKVLDGALIVTVGPAGAWLLTCTLLTLLTLAFFPKLWEESGQVLGLLSEHLHEGILRWRARWNRAKVADPVAVVIHPNPQLALTPALTSQKSESVIVEASFETSFEEPVQTRHADPDDSMELKVPSYETDPEPVIPPPPPAPRLREPDHSTCILEEPAEPLEGQPASPPVTGQRKPPSDGSPPTLASKEDPRAAVPRALPFELPPLALLDDVPPAARRPRSEDKSQALLDALDSFGVKAKLLQIVRGPTVTRYELLPARGVKVSKFTSLTNDIALALASTAVRIEAPIPGKSAIGIEIPNDVTDLVVIKDILRDTSFTDSKGLTVALGKDLSGRPVVTDLQKMPHLLVAGTTGSGKSVCVNGLILSLLYRFTPDQLQLMMVDPKQVELSVYEDIPHLVGFSEGGKGEIIVDPKKAAMALYQVVELMEQRYTLFAECRVRNLAEYNAKSDTPLPWFVVIIDELADLMMVASKSVETSICRIAQKARAAGIHLVLATQRPSADVITGLIKVNIPSRAAFAVSSQVDSRVILDSGGAEHLLGKGDMLFLPVDASDPKRLQGAYVNNDEISRVVEFWKGQHLPENRIEFELKEDPLALEEEETDEGSDDALLEEALRAILQRDQASASMLQTDLKVGYARARRLLMAMEKKGWVSPAEGSKPRKILYSGPLPGGEDGG
jgi:DNA segregation ATPase FtsK/SpoIIIE-like protein